jgi:hypothetical protein
MDPSSSPFREYDSAEQETTPRRFLGMVVVPTRYIKTGYGVLHGISSLASLVLGNFLFIQNALLGLDETGGAAATDSPRRTVALLFWLFTVLSSLTTISFYWSKVQSWQLSTTTMKEKGLTPKQLQNFNRGRGTLVPLSYTLLPLLVVLSVGPQAPALLESESIPIIVALVTIALAVGSFRLIREYSKVLFVVYGLYPALVSVIVVWNRQLPSVLDKYPLLMRHMEHQAYFVISCIQVGFLLYYLYSRRLISKEFVQEVCKHYHPAMMFSYLVADVIHFGSGVSILPWPLVIHSAILRLAGIGYAVRMGKVLLEVLMDVVVQVTARGSQPAGELDSCGSTSRTSSSTRRSSQRRRSSAFFLERPVIGLEQTMLEQQVSVKDD